PAEIPSPGPQYGSHDILCITGIPGNILAFYIVLYNKSKLNSTMIYLINLTAADLLFTLSLPARIVYYSYGFYWSLRELMCKIISCIFFMNTYVSIAFMLCISVDRYLAVIHPMKSVNLRSVSVVKSVCAGVWVVIFLQTALTFFTQELVKREGSHQTCMEFSSFEKSEYLPLILCGCLVSYYIPFAVIIFSYSCISLKLYQMRKQNLSGGTSNRAQNYRSQIVVLAVLVVFLVCFTPYHIGLTQHVVKMLTEEPICKTRQDFQVFLQSTVALMNINCCLDPFINLFASRQYKGIFLKLVRNCLCKTVPQDQNSTVKSNQI
uniref:G-protein coupled receptors family 1 profile domain-containing protein n=1 Tax=Callorhinchus milii TaxID=7868 RepID=A0A4W3HT23_CALMI